MLSITHHRQRRGLRGKSAYAPLITLNPLAINAGMPVPTTPNGATPGTISTTPTVVVVSPPTATPPFQPPTDSTPVVFPPSADMPTVTATPGFDPIPPSMPGTSKAWVPWAIGGGVVAALGAVIFGVLHR